MFLQTWNIKFQNNYLDGIWLYDILVNAECSSVSKAFEIIKVSMTFCKSVYSQGNIYP